MNHFCFIIPRTPNQFRTPLREFLWKTCVVALINQRYQHWSALVIGEREELSDSRFIFLEKDLLPKQEKTALALDWINCQERKPDYLIRLDDDDIISSILLEEYADSRKDCIGDDYHYFLEVCSQRISRQRRPWLPNTVLHLYQHAITPVKAEKYTGPLICHDHSLVWHSFYKDRLIAHPSKNKPVYLRILSPNSITSRSAESDKDESGRQYLQYLLSFGDWMTASGDIRGFEKSIEYLTDGLLHSSRFDLPVLNWPIVKLWKNRWMAFKQERWK